MTPSQLAQIHAAAFAPSRGWSAQEFEALFTSPTVQLFHRPSGFALVRNVADEAELLTLAVHPSYQRLGIASALMREWMAHSRAGTAFLEVAADNHAARELYQRHGFAVIGQRKGYYARPDGVAVDAVLMQAALTHGQMAKSPGTTSKTG